MLFRGRVNPVLIMAFKYASKWLSPKHATSPVLAISTLSFTSAPSKRENENWGTCTRREGKERKEGGRGQVIAHVTVCVSVCV